MDYWFIAYLLICFAIAGTFLRMFATTGQTTAALVSTALLIAIFVFYGLRWFRDSELKGASAAGGMAWPPIVNACPDFMVTYTASDRKVYCYDAGNIYKITAPSTDGTVLKGIDVNNSGSKKGVFLAYVPPATEGGKPTYPLQTAFKENKYTELVQNNLRWEGVWDGINVTK